MLSLYKRMVDDSTTTVSLKRDIWECGCVLVMLFTLPTCLCLTSFLVGNMWTRFPFIIGYSLWRLFLDCDSWWGSRMRHRGFLDPISKGIRSYFSAEIKFIDKESLIGSGPMIFCCHPHGIFGISTLLNFGIGAYTSGIVEHLGQQRVHVLTLRMSFLIPFWREILVRLGLGPVDRATCKYILKTAKESIAVVIGGAREALNSRPGVYEIILRKRRGVFKLSIETDCPVVPTFSFGEVDLYNQVSLVWPFSLLQSLSIRLFGFSLPLPVGRFRSLLPFRRKLRMVVGRPIYPSGRTCEELHEAYIAALESLFTENSIDNQESLIIL